MIYTSSLLPDSSLRGSKSVSCGSFSKPNLQKVENLLGTKNFEHENFDGENRGHIMSFVLLFLPKIRTHQNL